MRAEEFRRVTEVTYLGYVHGTLAALRRMLPRDRGVIVQVGSALAYRGIPLQSAYCAAKHAIAGFTDSLRCELIHDGSHVRVTMVQHAGAQHAAVRLGASRLPRKGQPVPPIFQPEVAARAIVYAAEHPRREMLGRALDVVAISGQKLAPGLLDWYLGKTGYAASRPTSRKTPTGPTTSRSPLEPPVDHGAHGRFDGRAEGWSPALELAIHRRVAFRPPRCLVSGGVRGSEDRSETRRVLALEESFGRPVHRSPLVAGAEYSSSPTGSPQSVSAPSSPAS